MQGEKQPGGRNDAKEEVFVIHADSNPTNSEATQSNVDLGRPEEEGDPYPV